MTAVRFKDLCIEAVDPKVEAEFWAPALGLQLQSRRNDWWLTGPTPEHTIWINKARGPKKVKNRVHLDVRIGSVAEFTELGAAEVGPVRNWTVMTDPDGQEFCAFERKRPPEYRLADLVVDAADPRTIAGWWAKLFGGHSPISERGYCDIAGIDGLPWRKFTFLLVPEPKTVKNRVHWDVYADPDELLAAGASMLKPRSGKVDWDVMADPEGNEFCVHTAG